MMSGKCKNIYAALLIIAFTFATVHAAYSAEPVTANVAIVSSKGDPVTSSTLTKENFRVFDCKNAAKKKNCVEQQITDFAQVNEPITAILALEYSLNAFLISCLGQPDSYGCGYYGSAGEIETAPEAFFRQLQKDDWSALMTYDMRSRIEVDFTQNKDELIQVLHNLLRSVPSSRESNLFDMLDTTLDRIDDVRAEQSAEHKALQRVAIILVSTGIDTFSKKTLDKILKRVRNTDVVIYPIRIGRAYENRNDPYMAPEFRLTLLQAANQLNEFAKLTGGTSYSPGFAGELFNIYGKINAMLRNQYTLTWTPQNIKQDGKFHELRVEVNGDFQDQEKKPLEIKALHRKGYIAARD